MMLVCGLQPGSRKASPNNPELSLTLWMCTSATLAQLNMDRLLRDTTGPEREPARERRRREINGDGREKVSAWGEPGCGNVSAAEGKRWDGGGGGGAGGRDRSEETRFTRGRKSRNHHKLQMQADRHRRPGAAEGQTSASGSVTWAGGLAR